MTASTDAGDLTLAIVASRWNDAIVSRLIEGALAAIVQRGGRAASVTCVRVPGAFEIPLVAQRLAASGRFDAVIALGCLIRGETLHFEQLSAEVTHGLCQVALTTGVPVTHGVLAVESAQQALERCGGPHGHKGAEAALAAIELANLIKLLPDRRG